MKQLLLQPTRKKLAAVCVIALSHPITLILKLLKLLKLILTNLKLRPQITILKLILKKNLRFNKYLLKNNKFVLTFVKAADIVHDKKSNKKRQSEKSPAGK